MNGIKKKPKENKTTTTTTKTTPQKNRKSKNNISASQAKAGAAQGSTSATSRGCPNPSPAREETCGNGGRRGAPAELGLTPASYFVYPDQPVLCGVRLLQHVQLKVLVPDLSIAHAVVARRPLCGDTKQRCATTAPQLLGRGSAAQDTHWPRCRPARSGSSTSCTSGS